MHEDIEGIISSRNSKMIKQCTGQKKRSEEETVVIAIPIDL
jgi:hypothetical protein